MSFELEFSTVLMNVECFRPSPQKENPMVLKTSSLVIGLALFGIVLIGNGCSKTAPIAASTQCPPVSQPKSVPVQVATSAPTAPLHTQAKVNPSLKTAAKTGVIKSKLQARLDSQPVKIKRVVLAEGVESHEPINVSSTFEASQDRRYAFMELSNPTSVTKHVSVTFERPDGKNTGVVKLKVPANQNRWRTWAWTKRATTPGSWTLIVRSDDGRVLATTPFEVTSLSPNACLF
jgi:hypothetical protein